MDFISLAEKQIDNEMDKLFGENSSELKVLTKLARLKELYGEDSDLNQRVYDVIEKIKFAAKKEATMIANELKCGLDSSGNVILLNE